MFRAPRTRVLLAAAFVLTSAGCNTPDAVSKFCAASTTTLSSATPVFKDLKGSCLREKNLEKDIGTFVTIDADTNCTDIGKQGDGAIAAAQVLSDYFNAINSIATFGTAKSASNASALVSKAGAAFGADPLAQKALGSIGAFLTTAAESGYQQRALNKDLLNASQYIGVVANALARIVQDDYQDLLSREDRKLATHYLKFSQRHTQGDVTLQLDDRWHTEQQAIAAKQASAQSLITALQGIRKGAADLAANGQSIKAKQLPGLLAPYTTQLETLIPQIQKAF